MESKRSQENLDTNSNSAEKSLPLWYLQGPIDSPPRLWVWNGRDAYVLQPCPLFLEEQWYQALEEQKSTYEPKEE